MSLRTRLDRAERHAPKPPEPDSDPVSERERHNELETRFLCSLSDNLLAAWAFARQNATHPVSDADRDLYELGSHIVLEAHNRAWRTVLNGTHLLPEEGSAMAHPNSSYAWRDERRAEVSEEEAERRYAEVVGEVDRRARARRRQTRES